MTVTMQTTRRDSDEAATLARSLLARRRSVLIIARDVAPFAMLVNEFGDLVQTVEVGDTDGEQASIIAYASESTDVIDALITVEEEGPRGRHGTRDAGENS